MEKEALELLLKEGLSIERIGALSGKGPSTVSYWMEKYELKAVNGAKHTATGAIGRETLAVLVASGASIAEIAEECDRSKATIRHWLAKYRLETQATVQRRITKAAREAGLVRIPRYCRYHGATEFFLERRGTYRCLLCRHQTMARSRERSKKPWSRRPAARACFAATTAMSAVSTFTTSTPPRRTSASATARRPVHSSALGTRFRNVSSCAPTAMGKWKLA